MKCSKFSFWCAVIVFLCGFSAPVLADDWQGSEIKKDGIIHVMNPAEPVAGTSEIDLIEQWRLGGDTEDDDEFFGVIVAVVTDGSGNVYLLDAQLHRIMVYNPDGEFIRSIGREGEGPGEFRRPGGMVMLPGGDLGIMQRMPGKIIALTTDGDPADNYPVPGPDDGGSRMFFRCTATSDRVIVGANDFIRSEDSFRSVFRIIGVTPWGEQSALYLEVASDQNMANFTFDEKKLVGVAMPWDVGENGTVYANPVFDGYRIDVWNADGTPDRIIHRQYQSRVRSSEERDRMHERMRVRVDGQEPKKIISKTDRDVQKLYPRDAGRLWVLSSRGALDAPDGSIGVFDVFDRNGRFVEQISLKGVGTINRDGYFFAGDRLYVVKSLVSARSAMLGGSSKIAEEEAEPISIICYEIGAPQHGMLQNGSHRLKRFQ